MREALAIARRYARKYAEGGDVEQPIQLPEIEVKPQQPPQVSEEDIERQRMNEANAPREGGLLQTIPQFISQMSQPGAGAHLWEGIKNEAANFIPGMWEGVKQQVSAPAEAMQHGITTEQAVPWAADLSQNLIGGHMPFAEAGQIGVFGGKGSAHFPEDKYFEAEAMRDQGKSRDEIWHQTGIGWDEFTQEPFYHQNMAQAELNPKMPKNPDNPEQVMIPGPSKFGPLTSVLYDPQLYEAYPFLKDWRVTGGTTLKGGDVGATFHEQKIIAVKPATPEEMRNTLIHEVNHAIQTYEGFTSGSNWRRFMPEGYTPEGEAALKQKGTDYEKLFKTFNMEPRAGWQAILDAATAPQALNQTQQTFVRGLIDKGVFPDLIDYINESQKHLLNVDQAFDKYNRSLGEIRSRVAEERSRYTPEESLAVSPYQQQQMLKRGPVKIGEELDTGTRPHVFSSDRPTETGWLGELLRRNATFRNGELVSADEFTRSEFTPAIMDRMNHDQLVHLWDEFRQNEELGGTMWSDFQRYSPTAADAFLRRAEPEVGKRDFMHGNPDSPLVGMGDPEDPQEPHNVIAAPKNQHPFERMTNRFQDMYQQYLEPKVGNLHDFAKKFFGGYATSNIKADKGILGGLYMNGILWDGPKQVAQIAREIFPDLGYAKHGALEIEEPYRGTAGPRILRGQFDTYKQIGLDRVEVNAGLDGGGYAWARYGFIPEKADWDHVRRRALRQLDEGLTVPQDPRALDVLHKIIASPDPKSIWDLADFAAPAATSMYHFPGQTLGNALLTHSNWDGAFYLRNPDQNFRFDSYVARKPKKPAPTGTE